MSTPPGKCAPPAEEVEDEVQGEGGEAGEVGDKEHAKVESGMQSASASLLMNQVFVEHTHVQHRKGCMVRQFPSDMRSHEIMYCLYHIGLTR